MPKTSIFFGRPLKPLALRPAIYSKLILRSQHGYSGPHKEYFQDPSQTPSREHVLKQPSPLPGTNSSTQSFRPEASRSAPSRPVQVWLLDSALWLGLSAFAGVVTGSLILGYTYVHWDGPFERGTEEDRASVEYIEDSFDEHPFIQQLRDSPLFAEVVVNDMPGNREHFLSGTLSGSRGISFKIFMHLKQRAMVWFIVFGSGTEGWPDVVHGGTLCTVFNEAYHSLAEILYQDQQPIVSDMETQFRMPVEPNIMYKLSIGPLDAFTDLETSETLLKPPKKGLNPLHDAVRMSAILTTAMGTSLQDQDMPPCVVGEATIVFPDLSPHDGEPKPEEDGQDKVPGIPHDLQINLNESPDPDSVPAKDADST
ncbi:MAG: hypothetical protein Q9227_006419 [Pyrenula ochraceoflavens]